MFHYVQFVFVVRLRSCIVFVVFLSYECAIHLCRPDLARTVTDLAQILVRSRQDPAKPTTKAHRHQSFAAEPNTACTSQSVPIWHNPCPIRCRSQPYAGQIPANPAKPTTSQRPHFTARPGPARAGIEPQKRHPDANGSRYIPVISKLLPKIKAAGSGCRLTDMME